MDCKIIWTPDAREDLREIYAYYSEKSRTAANGIISDINIKTRLLEKQPCMAPIESSLEDNLKTYRALLVYKLKFKVLYYVQDEEIHIMGIVNCKQSPEKIKRRLS